MKKKLLHLMLAVTVVLACIVSLGIASSAAISAEGVLSFNDVKSEYWFADAAEFCYANGVIKGMDDATFAPSGTLTRAQFVTMLANIEGVDLSAYSVSKFSDVKTSHWYYGAVAWAYNNGVVSGTSDTTFSPNANINRETLGRIMTLYMQKKGCSVTVDANCLNKFTDRSTISSWAIDGMKYVVSAGLVKGMTETTVEPKTTVTRAQAAVIIKSYMETYHYKCSHSYSAATCTESATCYYCGLKNGLPNGHTVASDFTCKSTGTQTRCEICYTYITASQMPHNYAAATCGKPATCVRCNATTGTVKGNHQWWAATCTNPKMCKVCYKTEGSALGHNWKAATCVAPKTCQRCKATEGSRLSATGQHDWWAATCKNPKMCKVCYTTEGTADYSKHDWWAATCTNPKMCKVCYKTEGSALGHNYKAATCTSPKVCARCSATEGSALGHNYSNGSCTRCGSAQATSAYDKAVAAVKKYGTYSDGGYEYQITSSSIVKVFGYKDNQLYLDFFYVFSDGDVTMTRLYISKNSNYHEFYYIYENSYGTTTFQGTGEIYGPTFDEDSWPSFDWYSGSDTYTAKSNAVYSMDSVLTSFDSFLYTYAGTSCYSLGFYYY